MAASRLLCSLVPCWPNRHSWKSRGTRHLSRGSSCAATSHSRTRCEPRCIPEHLGRILHLHEAADDGVTPARHSFGAGVVCLSAAPFVTTTGRTQKRNPSCAILYLLLTFFLPFLETLHLTYRRKSDNCPGMRFGPLRSTLRPRSGSGDSGCIGVRSHCMYAERTKKEKLRTSVLSFSLHWQRAPRWMVWLLADGL